METKFVIQMLDKYDRTLYNEIWLRKNDKWTKDTLELTPLELTNYVFHMIKYKNDRLRSNIAEYEFFINDNIRNELFYFEIFDKKDLVLFNKYHADLYHFITSW
jgi:hypothetical protein